MNWANIAGGLAGAGRGYEAAQGRNIPGPAQNGMLMKYLRNRNKPTPAPIGGGIPGGAPLPMPSTATPGPPPMVGAPAEDDAGPMLPQPNQFQNPHGAAPLPFWQRQQQGQPMAQGRVVDKPTTALIGEDGPEMVVPLGGRPDAKVSTGNLKMNYRRGC